MDWKQREIEYSEESLSRIVNLREYHGPESLPAGSFFPLELIDPGNRFGVDEWMLSVAKGVCVHGSELVARASDRNTKLSGWMMEILISGLQRGDEDAYSLAREMSKLFPNLAWMRGGELELREKIAVLSGYSFDGCVGRNVDRFVWYDIRWQPRQKPALQYIPWRAVVEGCERKQIRLGVHNCYDVTVDFARNCASIEAQNAWMAENLTVYVPHRVM
jgi:hypothetical protein